MIALLGNGLNCGGWQKAKDLLNSFGFSYRNIDNYRDISEEFRIVFSLGYSRIIPKEYLRKPALGVVVFHSSDLPKGRGWAPLFYTIIHKLPTLTQTMFFASEGVDDGPVIAKASYPLTPHLLLSDLRNIDDLLTLRLLAQYAPLLLENKIHGVKQDDKKASYWKKRNPEDSQIDPNSTILEAYDFLRALPKEHPAFFEKDGAKIKIHIEIERDFQIDENQITVTEP